MNDYQNLSVNELQNVIDNAEKALKNKLVNHRKEVIAQIRELASSIDIAVEFVEGDKKSSRKGVKVPAKYRHPTDPDKVWTGRGMKPKWLRTMIEEGRDLSEFAI